MATAKLWWNGSSWSESSAYWVNMNQNGNQSLGANYKIMIAAYDDNTIKLSASASGYQTSSIYFSVGCSNYRTVKSGDVTIGTGNFSNADVTNYRRFSYSGVISASGVENYKTHYSGDLSASGSTTITSPFRTITYNVNGGTGSVGKQTVLNGIANTVTPKATPTREYYVFAGWNTEADGTGTSYNNGAEITITEDTTLYAVWSQTAFAVSISADEGTTITFDGQAFTNATVTIHKEAGTYAVTITANAGFIIKTRTPAADGNVVISDNTTSLSATSQHVGCRIDDGNDWAQALIYVDDGTQWVMCQAYCDDGTQWILLN